MIKIFWQPDGINLDQIGDKRLSDISDGDTPNIRMNVRMLSIDTPEKGPTGRIRNLAKLDDEFNELADWIATGNAPISADLASYYLPRLSRPNPATGHVEQGKQATIAHDQLKEEFLRRPSGKLRNLFVRIADEPFDNYGRLLAYVAPDYTKEERAKMSRAQRATFNHMMVARGWAAPFIIYPSIPGEWDLPFFTSAARDAIENRLGAWADPLMLTGYEFRGLERLAYSHQQVKAGKKLAVSDLFGWIYRYCADISKATLHTPMDYIKVEPQNRLFIWKEDVRDAVALLNLTPDSGAPSVPVG